MIEVFVMKDMIHIEVIHPITRFETQVPCTLENLKQIETELHNELLYIQRYLRAFEPIDARPGEMEHE